MPDVTPPPLRPPVRVLRARQPLRFRTSVYGALLVLGGAALIWSGSWRLQRAEARSLPELRRVRAWGAIGGGVIAACCGVVQLIRAWRMRGDGHEQA